MKKLNEKYYDEELSIIKENSDKYDDEDLEGIKSSYRIFDKFYDENSSINDDMNSFRAYQYILNKIVEFKNYG